VFEFSKPRPGYFISKLRGIEFKFRGDYLQQCQGKIRRKIKYNFEKNPLGNLTLPSQQIFDLCKQLAEEKKYNLRSLRETEGFFDTIQNLASKYIDTIQFNHLPRQRDAEKLEDQLFRDENEEEDESLKKQEDQERETDVEEDVEDPEEGEKNIDTPETTVSPMKDEVVDSIPLKSGSDPQENRRNALKKQGINSFLSK